MATNILENRAIDDVVRDKDNEIVLVINEGQIPVFAASEVTDPPENIAKIYYNKDTEQFEAKINISGTVTTRTLG